MSDLDKNAVELAERMTQFGLDAVDLDMLKRGDMLGSIGAKVFHALSALSPVVAAPVEPDTDGWLIMKRGLYYGPDYCGYTGIRANAGVYTETEAKDCAGNGDNGVTMVRFKDAAEYTAACFDDLARAHMQGRIDTLTAALDGLSNQAGALRLRMDAHRLGKQKADARIAELEAALREARMQALASDGQAQEALGRVAELVAVVKPFADFDTQGFPDEMRAFADDATLIMGHFHRARSALSKSEPVKG